MTPPQSPSSWDDAALIQACAAGDQLAWRELVHRYASLVYSVPRRLGLDESTSDDVFQLVFEALLKQVGGIRDHKTLPKWLLTTSSRIAWKVLRRNRQASTLDATALPASLAEAQPSAHELAQQMEREHQVRRALEQLGGRCQELLTALYTDASPSYELIASKLGIPVGSIGPTRARCIEKLLALLRPEASED